MQIEIIERVDIVLAYLPRNAIAGAGNDSGRAGGSWNRTITVAKRGVTMST